MLKGTDGVLRPSSAASIFPEEAPLAERETDTALHRYFDKQRPANDNRRTYRSVRSGQPYHCICSTRWRYVDVSLARVSILDGAPAGAERRAA